MTSSADWLTPDPLAGAVSAWQPPDLTRPAAAATELSPLDEAYQRGWDECRQAMMSDGRMNADAMAAACRVAQRAMGDAAEVLRHQLVATVHALSVAIARHLIEWEVSQDPSHIRQLVSRAIAMAPVGGPVTVRMHPDDLAMLQSIGGITDGVSESIELRWTPDPDIGRGGCVLEGPTSIVDGRVDRALLDIYERLGHD